MVSKMFEWRIIKYIRTYNNKKSEKYKDKGFELVSFTLDHERDKWETAAKEGGCPGLM